MLPFFKVNTLFLVGKLQIYKTTRKENIMAASRKRKNRSWVLVNKDSTTSRPNAPKPQKHYNVRREDGISDSTPNTNNQ